MKKILTILTTLIISLSLFSCMSIKEIPADKTAAQIIQLGQNASMSGSFSGAEFCYNTALDRFGDDPSIFVQATYELGHMFAKQKKYEKAKNAFNQIIALEDAQPGIVLPKYLKLCEMGLESITNATTPKTKKNK